MTYISPDNSLIFIHIPKTAGTSVIDTLYNKYGRNKEINFPRAHMRADEVKDIIGDNTWYRAKKFAIVRNPVDRAVSMYNFSMHFNTKQIPFLQWFESEIEFPLFLNNRLHMTDMLCDKKHNILVDEVFGFNELNNVCKYLRLDSLSHKNNSKEGSKVKAGKQKLLNVQNLTDTERSLIYERFKQDYLTFSDWMKVW